MLKNKLLDATPEHLATTHEFLRDVMDGLTARPHQISPRWFYDHHGSELFEAITELPEYYPTRTERSILKSHASEIGRLVGAQRVVVEFGSGSSSKTPLLLAATHPSAYVPIDISGKFLRESAATLSKEFPGLPIFPLEGDFTRPLVLPEETIGKKCLGFFPGSTIGNLSMSDAVDLLRTMRSTLGPDARLVLGADLIKDVDILVPAYADAQGVTAEFNLNLLHRINKELDGTIPVQSFEHVALWNERQSRIEMHLRATTDVHFTVARRPFALREGETLHTENSHKYSRRDIDILLRAAGWCSVSSWEDEHAYFSVVLAEANTNH